MKGSSSPVPVYTTPKEKVEVAPQEPVIVSPAPASTPEVSHPASNNFPENNNNVEGFSRIHCLTCCFETYILLIFVFSCFAEEGHSIYIRNLSLNATAEQVEEEFKKFGPIKPGGVQVRSHKVYQILELVFAFILFDIFTFFASLFFGRLSATVLALLSLSH